MEENRKIRLTKKVLKEALTELLLTMPVQKITVSLLCQWADVNRSTFYSHYETLYDVLDDLEKEFCENIPYIRRENTVKENTDNFLTYMKYVKKNGSALTVLLKNGRVIGEISKRSMELFKAEHPGATQAEQQRHLYFVRFACAGTYQLLEEWLQNQESVSSEEVAETIMKISLEVGRIEEEQNKKYHTY